MARHASNIPLERVFAKMGAKWEYKLLTSKDAESGGFMKGRGREQVEAYLNDLGEQGWEIVDIDFVSMEGSIGLTSFSGLAKRVRD